MKNSDTVYNIGVFGAAFYYLQGAVGISEIAWGIIKALLWPGFLVFELLQFLGA